MYRRAQIFLPLYFDVLTKNLIYFSNLCKLLFIRDQLDSQSLYLLIQTLPLRTLCKPSRLVAAKERKQGMVHCWCGNCLGNLPGWCVHVYDQKGVLPFIRLAGFCPQPVLWMLAISYDYCLEILLTKFPAALGYDALHFLASPVVCWSYFLGVLGELCCMGACGVDSLQTLLS